MSHADSPPRPLPEPLRGEEAGSFTHYSIVVRLPDIGRRMLAENTFSPPVAAALQALFDGIPYQLVRHIEDEGAPDLEDWRRAVEPRRGLNWLQVPWFFAETYFYRRVLAMTGFFQDGPGQAADPYVYQKRRGLETTSQPIRALAGQLAAWLEVGGWQRDTFIRLLTLDLWGNQADLSLWPADREDRSTPVDAGRRLERILADEAGAAAEQVAAFDGQTARVDLLADNAGFELVCDLALIDYLLTSGQAASARLHLKPHPTFVSDAMIKDVDDTLAFLEADSDPATRAFGARLRGYQAAERLVLREDYFWTSPLEGWHMPEALRYELAGAQLVISKGDANYRRLVGDRHWPFTTPFGEVVGYFPAPLVALRTCKSEVALGLRPGQADEVTAQDPAWLSNGQWGLIQFCG